MSLYSRAVRCSGISLGMGGEVENRYRLGLGIGIGIGIGHLSVSPHFLCHSSARVGFCMPQALYLQEAQCYFFFF